MEMVATTSRSQGLAGATLFLDLDDDGVRDYDEPRTVSASDDPGTLLVDETGLYSFANLGNGRIPYAFLRFHITSSRRRLGTVSPVRNTRCCPEIRWEVRKMSCWRT